MDVGKEVLRDMAGLTTNQSQIQTDQPASSRVNLEPPATRARSWWPASVNITPLERWGRVVVGTVGVVAGALLLTGAAGLAVTALKVLLILAGLDLIVTGALGRCPLYSKLGYIPKSLRRSS